jgi:hypothetical protein
MKLKQARLKARMFARRWKTDRFVIVENGKYDHCSERDLYAFYNGAKVVAAFDRTGDQQ